MRAALPAIAFLLSGCGDPEPTSTSGLATNELSLQIIVDGDETGTTVSLGIYSVGHDYARLELAAGERLVLSFEGGAPIAFEKIKGSIATYTAHVDRMDGELAIDFERGGNAIRSFVTLPPPFAITDPTDGLHLDRPFTIAWGPALPTASVKASITSECVRVGERVLSYDGGSFTWSAADYAITEEPFPCTATIRLARNGGSVRIAPELRGVQLFRAEHHRAIGVLASRP